MATSPRLVRGAIGLAALLVVTAMGGDTPVPWPLGAPSADELAAEVENALARAALVVADEQRAAEDPGADAERIVVAQEDIDAGTWDVAALLAAGDALFRHEFRAAEGFGDAGVPVPLRRVHAGRRGGLDAFSCAACHGRGGPHGAGALTQNAYLRGDGTRLDTTLVRNPPAVIGLGLVQALAAEMTRDLQTQRSQAAAEAEATGAAVDVALRSKGVEFGTIVVAADGTVDAGGLQGVDDDLVVKPFGWKGTSPSLRRVIEDEALVHFGIQSHVLALAHQADPDPERLGDGPDPLDPDGDGKTRELEEGTLTATAVFLATLETPQIIPPSDADLREAWWRGSALFDTIGCADCHVRELSLVSTRWDEYPDTTGGPPVSIDLLEDGELPKGTASVQLLSDLKRHDMGPDLADAFVPDDSTIPAATFLTRPLWGLAETGPWLHDGRATTIPAAIEAHGGEAAASRDAFVALPESSRADLHVFLLSLSRTPRLQVPR